MMKIVIFSCQMYFSCIINRLFLCIYIKISHCNLMNFSLYFCMVSSHKPPLNKKTNNKLFSILNTVCSFRKSILFIVILFYKISLYTKQLIYSLLTVSKHFMHFYLSSNSQGIIRSRNLVIPIICTHTRKF